MLVVLMLLAVQTQAPDSHRQARRPARTQGHRAGAGHPAHHRDRGGRRGEARPGRHRAVLRAGRPVRGGGRLHRPGAERLDRHHHGDRGRPGSGWTAGLGAHRGPDGRGPRGADRHRARVRRRSRRASGSGSRPPPSRRPATGATPRSPGPRARRRVATVRSDGQLTAVGAGEAIITAKETTGSDVTGTLRVRVVATPGGLRRHHARHEGREAGRRDPLPGRGARRAGQGDRGAHPAVDDVAGPGQHRRQRRVRGLRGRARTRSPRPTAIAATTRP